MAVICSRLSVGKESWKLHTVLSKEEIGLPNSVVRNFSLVLMLNKACDLL